ncbi:hypothetical protein [Paraburkholderia phosphatilytica]|uniref:hypothetical protein n=1 Tax=Paraburkholderia phosphatilytica TaxID=2282883 RepID=UPI000F5F9002|nr:hypothetical protein [Paraburkholderia phosphatilytica]
MNGTTQQISTRMDGNVSCSLGQEKSLSFEPSAETHALSGENSLMIASTFELASANQESIAQSFETSRRIEARTLFDRRTQLLIASGLVAGIIPMSIRKRSNQGTLDFASLRQGGSDAAEQKTGF